MCPPRAKAAIPRLFSAGSSPPREHLRKSQRRSRDSRVPEHYKLLPLPIPFGSAWIGLGFDTRVANVFVIDGPKLVAVRSELYRGKGFFWSSTIRFRVNNLQTNFDANPILQSFRDSASMDEKKESRTRFGWVVFFDRKC